MDDLELIKQLKARYFRSMDTKDWNGFRATLTEDVVFDIRGGLGPSKVDDTYDEPPLLGAEAATSFISGAMEFTTSDGGCAMSAFLRGFALTPSSSQQLVTPG